MANIRFDDKNHFGKRRMLKDVCFKFLNVYFLLFVYLNILQHVCYVTDVNVILCHQSLESKAIGSIFSVTIALPHGISSRTIRCLQFLLLSRKSPDTYGTIL